VSTWCFVCVCVCVHVIKPAGNANLIEPGCSICYKLNVGCPFLLWLLYSLYLSYLGVVLHQGHCTIGTVIRVARYLKADRSVVQASVQGVHATVLENSSSGLHASKIYSKGTPLLKTEVITLLTDRSCMLVELDTVEKCRLHLFLLFFVVSPQIHFTMTVLYCVAQPTAPRLILGAARGALFL
jgi:hypothetical protein